MFDITVRMNLHKRVFALAALFLLMAAGRAAGAETVDLVSNGDFEEGIGGWPVFWKPTFNPGKGAPSWATDQVHGGSRSAKISATEASLSGENSPGWSSPLTPVSTNRITASGWIKTQDVVEGTESWHRASLLIGCYDANKDFIENHDLARLSGTADWTRYEEEIVLPSETRFVSVRFYLTRCRGTVWADDVRVTEEAERPQLEGAMGLLNPRVDSSQSVDVYNLESIAAEITSPGMTDEEKAIAVHVFVWEAAYDSVFPHECVGSAGSWCNCNYDVPKLLNMYPWGECGMFQGLIAELLTAVGVPARKSVINSDSHWVTEAYFDGGWHYFESRWGMYWCKDGVIASLDDLLAESLPACPGPGSLGGSRSEQISNYRILNSQADPDTAIHIPFYNPHSMRIDLRRGEAYILSYEIEGENGYWYCPPDLPPETVEVIENRNGWPIVEGPKVKDSTPSRGWLPHPAFCNSKLIYSPDFQDGSYVDGVAGIQNTAAYCADGLEPNLHAETAGEASFVIFEIRSPLIMTAGFLDGIFTRTSTEDSSSISISADSGLTWDNVWTMEDLGTSALDKLDITPFIYGAYRYLVRFEFFASSNETDAGVSSLRIENVLQSSANTVPRLGSGENAITITIDNPEVLNEGDFSVEYCWTEGGIERNETIPVFTSPTEHTIVCSEEPTTRYVRMAVESKDSVTPDADDESEVIPEMNIEPLDSSTDPEQETGEVGDGDKGCSCTIV